MDCQLENRRRGDLSLFFVRKEFAGDPIGVVDNIRISQMESCRGREFGCPQKGTERLGESSSAA
jgi:hypothetical protein